MQFSLKSLMLCVACFAAATAVLRFNVVYNPAGGPKSVALFVVVFTCSGGFLGAGVGTLVGYLWRGLLIGLTATGGALGIFLMAGGR